MNFPGRGSQGSVFDKEFESDMSCLLCILLRILCNFSQPTEEKEISANETALELCAPLE